MSEKIGIITFHQAYALQTILREQGHHVEIINYFPKYLGDVYKHRITLPTDTVCQKFLKLSTASTRTFEESSDPYTHKRHIPYNPPRQNLLYILVAGNY